MPKVQDREADAEAGKPGRAADDLFQIFADKINSGALREGEPLPPEREIVESYGVSRTVVREAVLALANRGLVEARPRFRPVVSKPSYDTAFETVDKVVARMLHQPGGVKNLFNTRIMVEAALVRQAAVEATDEDLESMREALDANGEAIEDSVQFYRTDIAFHAVLYQVPRNPVLPAIHKAYTSWLAPQWAQMPRLAEHNRRNHKAHKAIYRAIRSRDADAAEAALRAHLDGAWQQVRETFGDI